MMSIFFFIVELCWDGLREREQQDNNNKKQEHTVLITAEQRHCVWESSWEWEGFVRGGTTTAAGSQEQGCAAKQGQQSRASMLRAALQTIKLWWKTQSGHQLSWSSQSRRDLSAFWVQRVQCRIRGKTMLTFQAGTRLVITLWCWYQNNVPCLLFGYTVSTAPTVWLYTMSMYFRTSPAVGVSSQTLE